MQTENTNQLEKSLGLVVALDQIEAEVDSRLKKLARSVKMQGFRPGKVPLKIVAQQYGSQVRQEVLADAVQKRFSEPVLLSPAVPDRRQLRRHGRHGGDAACEPHRRGASVARASRRVGRGIGPRPGGARRL